MGVGYMSHVFFKGECLGSRLDVAREGLPEKPVQRQVDGADQGDVENGVFRMEKYTGNNVTAVTAYFEQWPGRKVKKEQEPATIKSYRSYFNSNPGHPNQDNPVGRRQLLHFGVPGATSAEGVILHSDLRNRHCRSGCSRQEKKFIHSDKSKSRGRA